MKKKMFDNSNLQQEIVWGNIPVGNLTDEELHTKNWNRGVAIKGRKRPDQSARVAGINNPMSGKTHPNKGKLMPQIGNKIKGKKKPEGHGANVSAARKGVPIPKLQGRKRPKQSARMKEHNPGFDKTRELITCIHCNKIANVPNHSRWHGNNCKMKK